MVKTAEAEDVLYILIQVSHHYLAAALCAVFLQLHEEAKTRGTDIL